MAISVIKEPIVRETDPSSNNVGLSLRLDLGVRGVWSPQRRCLIIDTDTLSYKYRTPEAVLESAAKEIKRMYQKAVEDRRGQFIPFVVGWTTAGLLLRETIHFIKTIAAILAMKWEVLLRNSYRSTCRLSFYNLEICLPVLARL